MNNSILQNLKNTKRYLPHDLKTLSKIQKCDII